MSVGRRIPLSPWESTPLFRGSVCVVREVYLVSQDNRCPRATEEKIQTSVSARAKMVCLLSGLFGLCCSAKPNEPKKPDTLLVLLSSAGEDLTDGCIHRSIRYNRGVYGMVFRYAWVKGAILFIASRSVLTMPPTGSLLEVGYAVPPSTTYRLIS